MSATYEKTLFLTSILEFCVFQKSVFNFKIQTLLTELKYKVFGL